MSCDYQNVHSSMRNTGPGSREQAGFDSHHTCYSPRKMQEWLRALQFSQLWFQIRCNVKGNIGRCTKAEKTPDHTFSLLPRQCVLSHSYYSPISGSVCYRASPISDWHCFHVGIGAMTHLVRQTLPALMKYKSVIEFLISPSITSRTFKCHGNTSTFTRLDVSQSDYGWRNSFHSLCQLRKAVGLINPDVWCLT